MMKKELNTLAANVARLSNLLTRERDTLPLPYLKDKGLREAYILYYLPANMYKIHVPLRELSLHPAGIFRKDKLRILDLGSGPGTAILGVMDFFSSQGEKPFLEFIAVDPIEKTKSLPEGPFDIIILSNVLSDVFHPEGHPEKIPLIPPFSKGEMRFPPLEKGGRGDLKPDFRVNLLMSLLKRSLAGDGSCIIIEPALRATSRELLEVRDGLLREGLHIYS